ncbi:MAG: glycosyltransferase [Alphaproteobacteria bacterium]|nr:glycosyltransferase [Alphaproteobacteria bacterium]
MRAAIVTGADHGYFPLMHALLRTLAGARIAFDARLLVLDFGLKPLEIATIQGLGAEVVQPSWWFDVPTALRNPRNLGYAARPMIPAFLPGYDVYLWLDADISVHNGQFVADFLDAAANGALAVVKEADPAYRTELYALKWRVGNAFRCFGLADGLRLCLGRQINSGAFALRADAPHWAAWRRHYQRAVTRAGRANLDQHALMATLCLDGLPASYLGSSLNWICSRAQPIWDDHRKVFCRPLPPFEPISVLHLAGRHKRGVRDIQTLAGGVKSMPLSYAEPAQTAFGTEAVSA